MTVQEAATISDILARIAALRAMRALARETGDEAKAIELSNEIGRLTQDARKAQQAQRQEATPLSIEGYNVRTGTRYRISPKLPTQVEYQMPSLRWQVVQVCRTPDEARALLAKLASEGEQEAPRD